MSTLRTKPLSGVSALRTGTASMQLCSSHSEQTPARGLLCPFPRTGRARISGPLPPLRGSPSLFQGEESEGVEGRRAGDEMPREELRHRLNCIPSKRHVDVLVPGDLRMWPDLEISSLQRQSSENELIKWSLFQVYVCPYEEDICEHRDSHMM